MLTTNIYIYIYTWKTIYKHHNNKDSTMNKNDKILLVEQGMIQTKFEMKMEYIMTIHVNEIEGWCFQEFQLYYPSKLFRCSSNQILKYCQLNLLKTFVNFGFSKTFQKVC